MTATQEPEQLATAGESRDRKLWEELRRDAYNGMLWPAGDRQLQELHARYPHWVQEW